MASENARAVAYKVVEMVGKGQKVDMGDILRSHGYSERVALKPDKVTKTKSYQSIVIPALKKMENVRGSALRALEKKDPNQEKYATLLSGVDILTKNIQLLSGRSTENIGINIQISEAIANKYTDVSSKDTKAVDNNGMSDKNNA